MLSYNSSKLPAVIHPLLLTSCHSPYCHTPTANNLLTLTYCHTPTVTVNDTLSVTNILTYTSCHTPTDTRFLLTSTHLLSSTYCYSSAVIFSTYTHSPVSRCHCCYLCYSSITTNYCHLKICSSSY